MSLALTYSMYVWYILFYFCYLNFCHIYASLFFFGCLLKYFCGLPCFCFVLVTCLVSHLFLFYRYLIKNPCFFLNIFTLFLYKARDFFIFTNTSSISDHHALNFHGIIWPFRWIIFILFLHIMYCCLRIIF